MYTLRTLIEMIGFAALAGLVLVVVFVVGQWAKLADILGGAGQWTDWVQLMGLTGLALLEAALPLVGLIAGGLVFGRRRADGAIVGYGALGWGPLRVYGPAFAFGMGCALVSGWLAAGPVPDALTQVRPIVARLATASALEATAGVTLANGAVLRREPHGGPYWLATMNEDGAATLIRAQSVEGRVWDRLGRSRSEAQSEGKADRVLSVAFDARDVWMWGDGIHAHVESARIELEDPALQGRMAMLGPPNSLPSRQLDLDDVHHRFTWHRRLALPLMAPLWALLGALLGGRVGGARALLLGAGAVTIAYWILRTGELSARAGFGSAVIAAWSPTLLLALVAFLLVRRL